MREKFSGFRHQFFRSFVLTAFKVSGGTNWEWGSMKVFWGQISFQIFSKIFWTLAIETGQGFQHCIWSPLENVLMTILFKKWKISYWYSVFNQIVSWFSQWTFSRGAKTAFCVAIWRFYGMKIFRERTSFPLVLWFGSVVFQYDRE